MLRNDLTVYAVSECNCQIQDILDAVKGGATFVQLREKKLDDAAFLEKAKYLKSRLKVPFVINDNLKVAIESDADGVHIGQSDGSVIHARAALKPGKILGVSCTTVQEAIEAEKEGADYLGVGAVFPTGSKDDAESVSLETLRSICLSVRIPVVAIGGISMANCEKLAGTGIAGIAVISAIFGQGNVAARTALLSAKTQALLNRPISSARGLLLDMDGVLVDSLAAWQKLDQQMLAHFGLDTPENRRLMQESPNLKVAWEILASQGLSLTEEAFQKWIEEKLEEYYCTQAELMPGCFDFLLRELARGTKIALLTATPQPLALAAMKHNGVSEAFDCILGNSNKQQPSTFWNAIQHLGTSLQETVVIDDDPSALSMAQKCGLMQTYDSINAYCKENHQ